VVGDPALSAKEREQFTGMLARLLHHPTNETAAPRSGWRYPNATGAVRVDPRDAIADHVITSHLPWRAKPVWRRVEAVEVGHSVGAFFRVPGGFRATSRELKGRSP
jgi:hypothetical protein